MKKYYLVILIAFLFSGCSEDIWLDHNDPRVYIPKYGFSINEAWILESGEYTIDLSAYCSGVRPDNQDQDIYVNYVLNPQLIEEYNNDISNEYSGQIVELPKDCYSFLSDNIIIPKGKSHGEVGIKINLNKMKALGLNLKEIKYAIPLSLSSTSAYNLQDDKKMLGAIYCITIDEPGFYFWDNRGETTDMKEIAKKVLYDGENEESQFRIVSYGLTSGEEYTLQLEVSPEFVPQGGVLLPENAYQMPLTVTIPANAMDAYLPVKIINNNIAFKTSYYLPVTIKSASKYGPAVRKATLLLKVEIKNDYEWNYKSLINVECEGTQRSAGYSMTKSATSQSKDVVQFLMLPNNTIAGAYGTSTYSSRYNNNYFRLRIIPTDNKRKYNLEMIRIDGGWTPATLEFDPEKESYYDWDYETFHLNYRFKDQEGNWVHVTEILEAQ